MILGNVLWMDELDLSKGVQDIGEPRAAKAWAGTPLTMHGKTYDHGIGTHARSEISFDLKGSATAFDALVGIDAETHTRGSVIFEVWVDGIKAARTDIITGADQPQLISADLTDALQLVLVVKDAGDGNSWDQANWADAALTLTPGATEKPETVKSNPLKPLASRMSPEPYMYGPRELGTVIGHDFTHTIPVTGEGELVFAFGGLPAGLTADEKTGTISGRLDETGDFPINVEVRGPAGVAKRLMRVISLDLGERNTSAPSIHGPRAVGTTPGYPFLFLIPATGEGPLRFTARNLPQGLVLDCETGIISGALAEAGEHVVELEVSCPCGTTTRGLTIVGGEHKLALTPPLGWNSWNVWALSVDAEKVWQAADWMVKSGLAAHGYQYINIDDGWEAGRDSNGEILANDKFGDMRALSDYVHSKGLKLGIYSSPGPKTCGGYEGSYQHEELDAKTWAKWGIDYLKHDWCSYNQIVKDPTLEDLKMPYRIMREALDRCDRDIVYSLCQGGWGNTWEWWGEVGANCWRTNEDIVDTWWSVSTIASAEDGHEIFAGPGHWNDPDMLVVGKLGWSGDPYMTHLTPYEQVTHVTLWSLLSSPLLLGCDLAQLDAFTVALITNDEVLDVNQDPLGKPAGRRAVDGESQVWARPLWDNTTAVGLVNFSSNWAEVTAKWSDLGLSGAQPVRDLWQRKDLGVYEDLFTVSVAPHGAMLVKVGKAHES